MESIDCEVCGAAPGVVVIELETHSRRSRRFHLCRAHAEQLRERGPTSAEDAVELFREPHGRRSVLSRRGVFERRQFPPRPEGRRRGEGRRTSD